MERLAYIAFDTVPAPKGAATHIGAFARALAQAFGRVDLITPGNCAEPIERWPGVFHSELPALGVSLVDRVLCFQVYLRNWLKRSAYTIIQFRSPFEGLPLLEQSPRPKLVFEVNGLPSIELKYRYAGVEDDRVLMRKLRAQEAACLEAADRIITPSRVTAAYLNRDRVHVIPNGVDLSVFQPARLDGGFRMLYFGTLHSWQGVELAIRALALVQTTLTVVGVGNAAPLERLAEKLGVRHRLSLLPAMPQPELATEIARSHVVLAPLALNDRNEAQGCCPLKILEAMACGVPVIASDLAVVRELGRDGEHFLLVKPGSVDQIATAILRLQGDPGLVRTLGDNARRQIEDHFTWERSGAALVAVYEEMMRDKACRSTSA